jgi:hypothetical protein
LNPKLHDSINLIIVEIRHNSRVPDLIPRCGGSVVAFLPQVLRFSAISWAIDADWSNQYHAAAAPAPQIVPTAG